jgi:hypothetical protein
MYAGEGLISAFLLNLHFSSFKHNLIYMRVSESLPSFKVAEQDIPVADGYDAWKRNKILKGLAQTKDRDALIPSEQVWRELGLEG